MQALTSLYCLMLAIFSWMAAYAGWRTSHGAAVWLSLIGLIALLLGMTPLVPNPWNQGG